MEHLAIKELKTMLNRLFETNMRIITLRRYKRDYDKVVDALRTTSKKKVIEQINNFQDILNRHGFVIDAVKQRKQEKIIKEQQIKDEFEARIRAEQQQEEEQRQRRQIQRQQQLEREREMALLEMERERHADYITIDLKSKHGFDEKMFTSKHNFQIFGNIDKRNMALKITDVVKLDYSIYLLHLKEVYTNMPNDKKIILNILGPLGWLTYKKKYLTKAEFLEYIEGDIPEMLMDESEIRVYACSTSYRQ